MTASTTAGDGGGATSRVSSRTGSEVVATCGACVWTTAAFGGSAGVAATDCGAAAGLAGPDVPGDDERAGGTGAAVGDDERAAGTGAAVGDDERAGGTGAAVGDDERAAGTGAAVGDDERAAGTGAAVGDDERAAGTVALVRTGSGASARPPPG